MWCFAGEDELAQARLYQGISHGTLDQGRRILKVSSGLPCWMIIGVANDSQYGVG